VPLTSVTLVTLAPVTPVVASENAPAVTPETAESKVTVKVTLAALVVSAGGVVRTIVETEGAVLSMV